MQLVDLFNLNFLATHGVFLGIFVILALSLALINNCAGMFSLGHQGFWAVGAYAAGAAAVGFAGEVPGWLLFAVSLVVGSAAAGIAGAIVGLPCLRLRGDYLAIATLGFAEITRILLNNIDSLGGSRGLRVPSIVMAKAPDSSGSHFAFYLIVTWSMVALTAILIRNLLNSRYGRAIYAIRDDESVAELSGVPVTRYRVMIFVLGATFAGLAGGIYANYFGILSPKDFGITTGVFLLLIVVLGGRGSMARVALAAALLYGTQQVLKLRLLGLPSMAANLTFEGLKSSAIEIEDFAADRWQFVFALWLMGVVVLFPHGLGRDRNR